MFRVSRLPLSRRFGAALTVAAALATLAACSSEDVLRPRADVLPSAADPSSGYSDRIETIDEIRTAAYMPRAINPLTWEQEQQVSMPAEEEACRKRLKKLDVTFEDIPRIEGGGQCGVAWPVRMSRVDGVELKNGATLNCTMAEAFARWVKKELVPSARLRYFSGVNSVVIASSYSCRWIKGRVGGTLSEHGKGNAIDIGSVKLDNGRFIDVRKPGFFAFREKGLLHKTRSEACDYFTTVLGPGYDRDHRDHFHFDLKQRRNGYVACK